MASNYTYPKETYDAAFYSEGTNIGYVTTTSTIAHEFATVTDVMGDQVEIKSVNNVHSYLWFEDVTDSSIRSPVIHNSILNESMLVNMSSVVLDAEAVSDLTQMSVTATFFNSTSNIDKAEFVLFRTDELANKTTEDIRTFIVNNTDTTEITVDYEPNIPQYDVFTINLQPIGVPTVYSIADGQTEALVSDVDYTLAMLTVAENGSSAVSTYGNIVLVDDNPTADLTIQLNAIATNNVQLDTSVALKAFNNADATDFYYLATTYSVSAGSVGSPVQHNIMVSVDSNNKYVFTPEVTSFVEGDTYVFDNSANGSHPLNFYDTNDKTSGTNLYQQDGDGIVTVQNFSTYDALFAHCSAHSNMGSVVNLLGTPIVPSTASPVQHNITVTVQSTAGGNKYVFTPEVTSFVQGDTYVFDNSANGSHPLIFYDTNDKTSGTNLYQQDGNGIVTVENFSAYDALFAHCSAHSNMGSVVNTRGVVTKQQIVETPNTESLIETLKSSANKVKFASLSDGTSETLNFAIRDVYDLDDDNTPVMLHTVNNLYVYTWAESSVSSSDKFTQASITDVEPYPLISNVRVLSDHIRVNASLFNPNGNVDSFVVCAFESSVFDNMSPEQIETNIETFLTNNSLTSGISDLGNNYDFAPNLFQVRRVRVHAVHFRRLFGPDEQCGHQRCGHRRITPCASWGCPRTAPKTCITRPV